VVAVGLAGLPAAAPVQAQGASSGASSGAAPAAPVAPVSPAKRELITRVLKLHEPGFENLGRTLAEQSVQQLVVAVRAALGRVPQDRRETLAREFEADVRRYLEDVVPLLRDRAVALAPATMGTLLEQRFSEEELRQLVAILESPVARKYQGASGEWQRALGGRLVAETKGTVEPKLQGLEKSVTDRLRAALPAGPSAGPSAAPPAAPSASAPGK
jgi:hypothetical protein